MEIIIIIIIIIGIKTHAETMKELSKMFKDQVK